MDFYKILSYGAIGLGCILAFFAYQLLRKEQDKKEPRKQILTSIYVFMVFSLFLCTIGFIAEFAKDREISEYKARETKIKTAAESLGKVLKSKEAANLRNPSQEIKTHIDLLKDFLKEMGVEVKQED